MAITATFYTFSKKKNSTAVPSSGGSAKNIVIKDPSSILNPRIDLDSSNPVSYNYCYIPAFNRYYFINDWISDHGHWIAECSVDVLASWKTEILNSYQFVLRSATYNNTYIEDSIYPMTANTTITSKFLNSIVSGAVFTGTTYILAISNASNEAKINGVQYLALSQSDFNTLIGQVLNDQSNYWGTGSVEAGFGITPAVLRSIINPLQYVSNAYLLPFTIDSSKLSTVSALKLGSWNIPFSGTLQALNVTENVKKITFSIPLDGHPQCTNLGSFHGTYLNGNPYSQYYVYAGPFGTIRLDNSVLFDTAIETEIECNIIVDFLGHAVCEIYNTTNHDIIAKAYADVSVPIPLTQTRNDILSWMGSFTGAIGAAASGNYGGTAASAAGCISSIDNILPKPETKGGQGSLQMIREPWRLQEEFHLISTIDANATGYLGKPLMELKQLSTLSGFCQTDKIVLDIPCYASEYDQISEYLTSGFFIVA